MRISDWSSDVCSSDLITLPFHKRRVSRHAVVATTLHPCRQGTIVGERHPPLCSGDQLYRVETENRNITVPAIANRLARSEEHTSELQSLMRISYAVFCLKKKKKHTKLLLTQRK